MFEIILKVFAYFRGIWRYRWYAAVIAWLLSISAGIVILKLPDQFAASARVFVETQSVLRPALQGLVLDTSGIQRQQLALLSRTLLSRPNLERLARMTDLDLGVKDPNEMEALIAGLNKQIRLDADKSQPNLYSISYVSSDPQLAKRVVQTLLTIFMESSLGSHRQDTEEAQRFLDAQIKEHQEKLIGAEKRLEEFKRKNVGLMPSEQGDYYSRMQTAMGQVEQVRLELRESENRRDELRRQIEDVKPSAGQGSIAAEDPRLAALNGRIEGLQGKLNELLMRFTERHPDVVAIKRALEQLQKEKERQQASLGPSPAGVLEGDGAAGQLKMALSEADANVASLKVRLQEYEKRATELKAMVDTMPQVETELKNLNRDYEVIKQNYNSLLQRREATSLGEQAQQSADTFKFQVIDPPRVPLAPIGPKRPLFLAIALLAGIAGGIAFALFMALTKPTIDDRRTLAQLTSLPVFGSVSMVWTRKQRLRNRLELAGFLALNLAFLAGYGVVLSGLLVFPSTTGS
jgi:polysaccharide chain length determinant protein (PEP-CTERM system associated)